jgi:hypothetical protein
MPYLRHPVEQAPPRWSGGLRLQQSLIGSEEVQVMAADVHHLGLRIRSAMSWNGPCQRVPC